MKSSFLNFVSVVEFYDISLLRGSRGMIQDGWTGQLHKEMGPLFFPPILLTEGNFLPWGCTKEKKDEGLEKNCETNQGIMVTMWKFVKLFWMNILQISLTDLESDSPEALEYWLQKKIFIYSTKLYIMIRNRFFLQYLADS